MSKTTHNEEQKAELPIINIETAYKSLEFIDNAMSQLQVNRQGHEEISNAILVLQQTVSALQARQNTGQSD